VSRDEGLRHILRFTARRLVISCIGSDLVLDVYAKRVMITCILLLYIHIYLIAKNLQSPCGLPSSAVLNWISAEKVLRTDTLFAFLSWCDFHCVNGLLLIDGGVQGGVPDSTWGSPDVYAHRHFKL